MDISLCLLVSIRVIRGSRSVLYGVRLCESDVIIRGVSSTGVSGIGLGARANQGVARRYGLGGVWVPSFDSNIRWTGMVPRVACLSLSLLSS